MELEVWLFLGTALVCYLLYSQLETDGAQLTEETEGTSRSRQRRHQRRTKTNTGAGSRNGRTTQQTSTAFTGKTGRTDGQSDDTGPGSGDPRDSTFYLTLNGWERISSTPERYLGHYEADGRSMVGALERTVSGRRKFFVANPPPIFWRRAENGRCLTEDANIVDGASEVHFQTEPDTFGDGIEEIERLLEDDP